MPPARRRRKEKPMAKTESKPEHTPLPWRQGITLRTERTAGYTQADMERSDALGAPFYLCAFFV